MLASYGIAGDITIPVHNEYGRLVSLSLLQSVDPTASGSAINYCNPLRSGQGVEAPSSGADFLRHLAVSPAPCPANAQPPLRRRGQRGSVSSSRDAGHIMESENSVDKNATAETQVCTQMTFLDLVS